MSPTITDWIQAGTAFISFITLVVLAVITGWYAKETRDIAKAAKEQAEAARLQADASVAMAREMKEGFYRPKLAPYRVPLEIISDFRIWVEVHNVGSGPATAIKVECWWKGSYYVDDSSASLSAGDHRGFKCIKENLQPSLSLRKRAGDENDLFVRLSGCNSKGEPFEPSCQKWTYEQMRKHGTEIDSQRYATR